MLYVALVKIFPAMVANGFPVILAKLLPSLNAPINRELFGKNKTWRGFVGGVAFGTLTGYFLSFSPIGRISVLDGFLMSLGALLGDLVKSYFKRRKGLKESESWVPFDQVDWIVGALAFTYYLFSPLEIIFLFFTLSLLHVATNLVACKLGFKEAI